MKYKIFIPTIETEKVVTYDNLPDQLKKKTTLVVSKNNSLDKSYPGATVWKTAQQGIGAHKSRQAVLNKSRKEDLDCCVLLVDSLTFKSSVWEGNKKFRSSTDSKIIKAFDALVKKSQSNDVGFTTFSTPFFNNSEEKWKMNRRMAYSFFINVNSTQHCSFLGTPRMSDIKFSLDCYTSCLKSYSLMDTAVVDASTESTAGKHRAKGFEKAIDYLLQHHPKYIKERIQKNKRHQQLIGTTRDITFYPSRAYKDSIKKPPKC